MTDDLADQERQIDGGRFQSQLDRVTELVAYNIERHWPAGKPAETNALVALATSLRTALHYYRGSCFLVAEQTRESVGWKNEHTLVLNLVGRTCLETLFNICFLLEDLNSRAVWFEQHGWREVMLEFRLYEERYGSSCDPKWIAWLESKREYLKEGIDRFKISRDQAEHPRTIREWPTPGKMWKFGLNEKTPDKDLPANRRFLKELYLWHYKPLSAEVHSNSYGHLRSGALSMLHVLPMADRHFVTDVTFPRVFSHGLARVSLFLLCMVCELQQFAKFSSADVEARLLAIWLELLPIGEVQELFDLRYKGMYPMQVL